MNKDEIEISVRVLDGDSGTVSFFGEELVSTATEKIAARFKLAAGENYRILFRGKSLDPEKKITEEGLSSGDRVLFGSIKQLRQFEDDAHVRIKGLPR